MTRVYVDPPLAAGERRSIVGSAANHIGRVLRLRAGDIVTLFDGSPGEYPARIEELRKSSVLVAVLEHVEVDRESALPLTLAQGVSRGERMDWVVQKATELGVTRIAPVMTERTVVRLDAEQADRKRRHWQGIAVAACEQSGRTRVPEVLEPRQLRPFLRATEPEAVRILLSPAGKLSVGDIEPGNRSITVLIGPEGGLTEDEQQAAVAAGFQPLRLGPRILRTETAAIAALTIIQQRFGDI